MKPSRFRPAPLVRIKNSVYCSNSKAFLWISGNFLLIFVQVFLLLMIYCLLVIIKRNFPSTFDYIILKLKCVFDLPFVGSLFKIAFFSIGESICYFIPFVVVFLLLSFFWFFTGEIYSDKKDSAVAIRTGYYKGSLALHYVKIRNSNATRAGLRDLLILCKKAGANTVTYSSFLLHGEKYRASMEKNFEAVAANLNVRLRKDKLLHLNTARRLSAISAVLMYAKEYAQLRDTLLGDNWSNVMVYEFDLTNPLRIDNEEVILDPSSAQSVHADDSKILKFFAFLCFFVLHVISIFLFFPCIYRFLLRSALLFARKRC